MKTKKRKITEFFERKLLLKNQTFLKKLFVFASCMVIFPVLAVGIISYQRSAVELEKEVQTIEPSSH